VSIALNFWLVLRRLQPAAGIPPEMAYARRQLPSLVDWIAE